MFHSLWEVIRPISIGVVFLITIPLIFWVLVWLYMNLYEPYLDFLFLPDVTVPTSSNPN